MMTNKSIRISLTYRIVLLVMSVLIFLMVLAGSHSGINFRNMETLFLLSSSFVFLVSFAVFSNKSFFLKEKIESGSKYYLLALLVIVIGLTIFLLLKLLLFDFDVSSFYPYAGILAFVFIIFKSFLTIRDITSLLKKG